MCEKFHLFKLHRYKEGPTGSSFEERHLKPRGWKRNMFLSCSSGLLVSAPSHHEMNIDALKEILH